MKSWMLIYLYSIHHNLQCLSPLSPWIQHQGSVGVQGCNSWCHRWDQTTHFTFDEVELSHSESLPLWYCRNPRHSCQCQPTKSAKFEVHHIHPRNPLFFIFSFYGFFSQMCKIYCVFFSSGHLWGLCKVANSMECAWFPIGIKSLIIIALYHFVLQTWRRKRVCKGLEFWSSLIRC